jgi:hypothetical protein
MSSRFENPSRFFASPQLTNEEFLICCPARLMPRANEGGELQFKSLCHL